MTVEYDTIHNHHEHVVYAAVDARRMQFPHLDAMLLADVACVALNRLPPRYIRHEVDYAFYLTDRERLENDRAVAEAVTYAFEFVQARRAMRARV